MLGDLPKPLASAYSFHAPEGRLRPLVRVGWRVGALGFHEEGFMVWRLGCWRQTRVFMASLKMCHSWEQMYIFSLLEPYLRKMNGGGLLEKDTCFLLFTF